MCAPAQAQSHIRVWWSSSGRKQNRPRNDGKAVCISISPYYRSMLLVPCRCVVHSQLSFICLCVVHSQLSFICLCVVHSQLSFICRLLSARASLVCVKQTHYMKCCRSWAKSTLLAEHSEAAVVVVSANGATMAKDARINLGLGALLGSDAWETNANGVQASLI